MRKNLAADVEDDHRIRNYLADIQERIDDAPQLHQSTQNPMEKLRAVDFKSNAAPSPDPLMKDAVADTSADDDSSDHDTTPGLFGTRNANPHLKTIRAPAPGSDTKAGDQLLSAAAAAKNNKDLTPNYEGGATRDGSLQVPKVLGQTPGAVDLESHIPAAAKSDKEIQQNMAYYEKLDGRKLDAQRKFVAVQQQIDNGTGDAKVLTAQKATLGNDLKRYEADQEHTQTQIQKRLKTINVPWIVSSSPATGEGASQ